MLGTARFKVLKKLCLYVAWQLGEIAMHQEVEIYAMGSVIVFHDFSIGKLTCFFDVIEHVVCNAGPLRDLKLGQAGCGTRHPEAQGASLFTHIAQPREMLFLFNLHGDEYLPVQKICIAGKTTIFGSGIHVAFSLDRNPKALHKAFSTRSEKRMLLCQHDRILPSVDTALGLAVVPCLRLAKMDMWHC